MMNLADLPNWPRRQKVLFLIACWGLFACYYYGKNQYGIPRMEILELFVSLPLFMLTAHGTFYFLSKFVTNGKPVAGIMLLVLWYAVIFLLTFLVVNMINPFLSEPFLKGEIIPVGNPHFLNSTITTLVNFSVVGFVFFLVYRTVSYANARRLEAEGKLAAMQKQAEAEAEKNRYEYLTLAGQVSPHFIVNQLLEWEARLGEANKQEAVSMKRLYGLLYYHIRASEPGREVVPLTEEAAQMQAFVTLVQNTNSSVFIDVELDSITAGYTVPPTTLLAFVDNACKYGVLDDPGNPVRIALRVENHRVVFRCSNLVRQRDSRFSHGIGLANTRRRLDIQYEGRYSLEISQSDGHYAVELSVRF